MNKTSKITPWFLLISIVLVMSSCRSTRLLKESEYLLDDVSLTVDDSSIDTEELEAIIKQNPNRRLLGLFRFHLGAHNYALKNRTTDRSKLVIKWKTWIENSIGEPPVVVDDFLTGKSSKQMRYYLNNNGYFDAHVTDTTIYDEKRKKASVHYSIKVNKPWTVGKITYSMSDKNLKKPIVKCGKNCQIKPGDTYSVNNFDVERIRMARAMKNEGYFEFSKEYILFRIDSTIESHKVFVNPYIKNPVEKVKINDKDTVIESKHQIYFIKNIYVDEEYAPGELAPVTDTVVVNDIQFLKRGEAKLPIRPAVLANMVFIRPERPYKIDNVDYTYNRLASLGQFKFISIKYEIDERINGKNYLNCYINLTRNKKQSFAVEAEGTHRAGNLGLAGNMSYANKNVFRGAEVFSTKVFASKEQFNDGFITEYGPQVSLSFPKLLLLGKSEKLPRYSSPSTSIVTRYNFQSRDEFQRNIANVSLKYAFQTSAHNGLTYSPVDISLVEIDKSPAFIAQLDKLNNSLVSNVYSNHMILATNLKYTYSSLTNEAMQKDVNHKKSKYLSVKVESAGNIIGSLSKTLNLPQDGASGAYKFFGIQYAQYVKPEIEIIFKEPLTNRSSGGANSKIVYRFFAGIGIPMCNSNVLPFEKSYFGGGSNGIRAWQARSLGPGGLSETTVFGIDHIGDIQLEGNVEYRFDLYGNLEGALFVDAGNIWLWNEDHENRPNGHFDPTTFYQQIAVGTGAGLRINLGFLRIRLDLGYPLRDPALPSGEEWVFQSKTATNNLREQVFQMNERFGLNMGYNPDPVLNLGLGYPF